MDLMKRRQQRALAGLMLWVAACGDPAGPRPTEISTAARAYLDEVIGVMQSNSTHRLTIDWTSFRAAVFAAAGPAQSVSQTFPGISKALALLGDGHSSYTAASGTFLFVPNRTCRASGALPPVSVPLNIGYVKVGAFSGTAAEATAFANGIQNTIRLADRDDLIGWIVDLRGNAGGNVDNGVASSGEATFIAFRERANTRSFGGATCGPSTANSVFDLSDGARLTLTVSVMADRAKTKYGDQVQPDETIEGQSLVVERAVAWLQAANP